MKEESLLLLSDLQKLINQVVLIDYTIIILGGKEMSQKNLIVYGKNGKRLGGGAAQLKRIKDNGGWDEHHRQVIADAVEVAYQTFEENENRVRLRLVK